MSTENANGTLHMPQKAQACLPVASAQDEKRRRRSNWPQKVEMLDNVEPPLLRTQSGSRQTRGNCSALILSRSPQKPRIEELCPGCRCWTSPLETLDGEVVRPTSRGRFKTARAGGEKKTCSKIWPKTGVGFAIEVEGGPATDSLSGKDRYQWGVEGNVLNLQPRWSTISSQAVFLCRLFAWDGRMRLGMQGPSLGPNLGPTQC